MMVHVPHRKNPYVCQRVSPCPPISLPRAEERSEPADDTTAQLLYGPTSEVSCFDGSCVAQGCEENGWRSGVTVKTSTLAFSWHSSFGPLSLVLLAPPPGPETLTPYLFIACQRRENQETKLKMVQIT